MKSDKKIKILFYNYQYQEIFANTVKSYITKKSKSPGGKYSYLLKEAIKQCDEVYIYAGKNYISSMNSFNLEKIMPKKTEINMWLKINELESKKIKIVKNLDKLDDDVIIFGSARMLLDIKNLDELKKSKLKKVFQLSHIFFKTTAQAKAVKKIGVDLLVSENNLYKNSKFFKKYFSFYKKNVYQLPFVPQKRFKAKKKFNSRDNLCLATGTWRVYKGPSFKEFLTFFKTKTLHPGRAEIGLNVKYLEGYVNNGMSNDYDSDTYKKVEKKDNFIIKTYKRIWNVYTVKKSYFKIDIVEQYNKHKMAAVPEEIIDVPGIGFAESMKSGCVFLGKDDNMYKDLGMKPKKHYIAYKGKKELRDKIKYYQNHPKELEKISKASLKFANEKFDSKNVSSNFFKYLKNGLK